MFFDQFQFQLLLVGLTTISATPLLKRDFTQTNNIPWTLRNFNRTCAGQPSCTYAFGIDKFQDPFSFAGSPCTITPPMAADQSFSNIACSATRYDSIISWGYDERFDTAVMTVYDPLNKNLAWFGFDAVNSKTEFGKNGPSAVFHCNNC